MKKRKSLLLVLSIAFLGILLTACGGSSEESSNEKGNALEEIKKTKTITVATQNDAPFAYMDESTNELTGIDADILREIGKRAGFETLEMKQFAFENLLLELNKGNADIVADGMYIRDARLEIAYFSDVWYEYGDTIITKKDSGLTNFDDLKDKTIGAQKGTAFYDFALAWKEEGKVKDVVTFGKTTELMLGVNTGKVDAIIVELPIASYLMKTDNSLNVEIMESYVPKEKGRIASAISFDNKELLDEINKYLNEMKEDGTLLTILEKYGLTEENFVSVEDGKTENIK